MILLDLVSWLQEVNYSFSIDIENFHWYSPLHFPLWSVLCLLGKYNVVVTSVFDKVTSKTLIWKWRDFFHSTFLPNSSHVFFFHGRVTPCRVCMLLWTLRQDNLKREIRHRCKHSQCQNFREFHNAISKWIMYSSILFLVYFKAAKYVGMFH